jgi:hypothetical protein
MLLLLFLQCHLRSLWPMPAVPAVQFTCQLCYKQHCMNFLNLL